MDTAYFTTIDWFELTVFVGLLFVLAPLLGRYMAYVFEGEKTALHRYLFLLESSAYKLGRIDPSQEMQWHSYLKAVLFFTGWGVLFLFALLYFQGVLPGNPQHFPGMPWLQALSTAISYTTKTSWQSYAGETSLSNLSQMAGLTVQNFASAATGNAILLAFIRGLTRNKEETIGNFWVDLVRTVVYVLLPLSIVVALLLTVQGTVQSFAPYIEAITLENQPQIIPLGPIASQVAIGQLGSNGEGFFLAGEAHPLANPSALSNFIECLCILLLPASLTFTYAHLIGSKRHGLVLLFIMVAFLALGMGIAYWAQNIPNPVINVDRVLEGEETRFGIANTLLWITSSTGTSNGSVNGMLSSLPPLAGGVALLNMLLGELIFGGLGVGLCSMLMFVMLTVFLAGLMVGRTPEFLGKKIDQNELRWILFFVFGPAIFILVGTAFALLTPEAMASVSSKGPHGFTELLYAFTSTVRNNGSAFQGLNSDTPFYHVVLSLCMLLGRLSFIVPTLIIAGRLVAKRILPTSAGTLATDTPTFAILLFCVIYIVSKLAFAPAFGLGPLMEHFLLLEGRAF